MKTEFAVLHRINPDFSSRTEGKLKLVAIVQAEDLEEVFEMTNHIDDDWTKNHGVVKSWGPCRSTSVGDVVISAGTFSFWKVLPVGFKQIN